MPDATQSNTPPDPKLIFEELVKVNQEMYKKNIELLTRNRTLSTLREIYDILNNSIGEKKTAQNLIQKIVNTLDFDLGMIALFDEEKRLTISGFFSKIQHTKINVEVALEEYSLVPGYLENICTEVLESKRMKVIDSWKPLLNKALPDSIINTIEEEKLMKTFFVHPIVFGGHALGVMVLGMTKPEQDLNHADEEVLNEIISVVGIGINQASNYTNLEEALRTERDMLDILGHELRTPLTIAKNAILLIEAKIKENKLDWNILKNFIDKAVDNLRRESKLIETILTSTKIDSNNLKLNPESVDLVDAINNSLLAFTSQATAKGLELILELPPKAMAFVDRIRVEEIIDNIISNAIKYTYKGFVRISVKEEGENIIFAVSDSGEGISEIDLKNLGKKFYRAHTYMNKTAAEKQMQVIRPGGTGLGLYVIFNLIRRMGGTVNVSSKLGVGSEFKVTLPKYQNQAVIQLTPDARIIDKIQMRKMELAQSGNLSADVRAIQQVQAADPTHPLN
jgi:signal transduction histidine kinase